LAGRPLRPGPAEGAAPGTVVVAALSARMLAEAAARDGFEVVALDLFGDVDTCEAASRWFPIGEASRLEIDGDRLLARLAALSQRGDVIGWVAGSGFEGRTDWLARGAECLPLIGNDAATVAAVRHPARFFSVLAEEGIGHPPVRHGAAPAAGWLQKDAGGCGGWQVRRAEAGDTAPTPSHYFQQEWPGRPMSATFVANRAEARVIGFNEQLVRPLGSRPYVFSGVLGPVPLPPEAEQAVDRAAQVLTRAFGLQGLASLDFLLQGEQVSVLELNPRPPASMALYAEAGILAAHVAACLRAELPPPRIRRAPQRVRGHEIVYAGRTLRLDEHAASRLAGWPEAHDLPCAGGSFEPGDPLCSLSATGADAQEVRTRLQASRLALLKSLET
jgi:uncharacterized protein